MPDATIIDGQAVASRLRQRVAAAVEGLRTRQGVTPGLAAIIVGNDPASQVYVRNKARACNAAGLSSFEHRLPGDTSEAAIIALIEQLNRDERVDGILVQLPLPEKIDPQRALGAVDPAKDVDGFHPVNVGRLWSRQPSLVPCTPQGCMILLQTVHAELAGLEVVVLGRSQIVGRPLAALLVAADCTVTIAHSRSRDPPVIARRADILIAATGEPQVVKGDWIKPGATVIDVGTNRIVGADGVARLVGDVDFASARAIAGAITPVPGGVGPMTIACLLQNTIIAACRRRGLPDPDLG
ncbi:MAG TPA: bifunctional methylenetetrahydrofolate dehydrogenase/methenyltetrahydrofolate cyclohydrolase FolD [Stellaceae bacterium]|jgi:methylenetetrahydrofolate dehydrogenase (NADP+)/methenyltetrahydrofolate cyclohydrolase|nr:bifunctional methylenetetrahydrofolate dehydrogenase/methenyltetrahydrofolate cyclohydrolase FolD [Stellaceae bacterium]